MQKNFPYPSANICSRNGSYDAAITEYKRFLYFHPSDGRIGEAYYNIGLAYRAQGLWTEAGTALRTATHLATDNKAKSEYQLELAVTLLAAQDYDLARLELVKVTMRRTFPRSVVPTRTFLAKPLRISISFDGRTPGNHYETIQPMKDWIFSLRQLLIYR